MPSTTESHEDSAQRLTTNAYRNADGKRVVFGLVFELDGYRAQSRWLSSDGRLSWPKISVYLEKEHAEVARFISHVLIGDDPFGLVLVVAINPLPLQDSTASNQRSALILANRLTHFFGALGFGARPRQKGLISALPQLKDPDSYVAYNRRVLRVLEEQREPVLSVLHASLNVWHEEYRRRRIYPDKRAEAGLAKLILLLTQSSGAKRPYSTKNLVAVTGLSKPFLRKFLASSPSWLRARYERETKAWVLALETRSTALKSLLGRAAELAQS